MSALAHRARTAPRVPLPYDEATANRAVPLLRRIVRDLTTLHQLWQDAVTGFEYATIGSQADAADAEADRLQGEAQRLARDIEACLVELDHLGADCRDPARGTIVLPGMRDGAACYFVWAPGDTAVSVSASANGTSNSAPSRAQDVAGNTSLASRSRSDGSRE